MSGMNVLQTSPVAAGSLNAAATNAFTDLGGFPTEKPHLIIRPPKGWAALNVAEIWHFRDLLMTLGLRDIKLRYKQTALGMIWVVLQPLLAAGIFSFVFGKVAGFKAPNGIPYFLFSYAGLLGWNLFSSSLTKSSACLVGNSQLISKVFFPRLVLPMSTIMGVMVDFSVAAVMLLVFTQVYHTGIHASLLLLPFWMTMFLMLSLGVGLCAAALTVSYRDVQYILPVALQFLLYASPVAYAVTNVPLKYRTWFYINPLTAPLEGFRWSIFGTDAPHLGPVAWSAALAGATFVLGAYSFKRMERKFADVI